jgi:hypothetical protein
MDPVARSPATNIDAGIIDRIRILDVLPFNYNFSVVLFCMTTDFAAPRKIQTQCRSYVYIAFQSTEGGPYRNEFIA